MHIIHRLNIQDIEQLYSFEKQLASQKSIWQAQRNGTAIQDLPADYVQWLLRQDDPDLIYARHWKPSELNNP